MAEVRRIRKYVIGFTLSVIKIIVFCMKLSKMLTVNVNTTPIQPYKNYKSHMLNNIYMKNYISLMFYIWRIVSIMFIL